MKKKVVNITASIKDRIKNKARESERPFQEILQYYGADYEGVRVKFIGFIDKTKIPMQLDVGFGDAIYPKPKKISYPAILNNMSRPQLEGYPVESVISEKFESMIKLGSVNSRMKDFYDIWILMRSINFSGIKLSEALKNTFEHRKTILPEKSPLFDEEIYDKNSDRQILWTAFLKNNDIINAPQELYNIAKQIERFIVEPLKGIHGQKEINKEWIAPGPWK